MPRPRHCGSRSARRCARSCAAGTSAANARSVAARAGRRRSGRAEGPRPFARADLCGAGEGRQGRRPRRAGRVAAAAGRAGHRRGPWLRLSGPRPRRRRICPTWRAQQGVAAAPIRRSHHCGAAGHPCRAAGRAGARRPALRQHAGGDRALGRPQRRLRHQPDRLRLPAPRARRRSSSTWRCRRSRAATSSRRSRAASGSPRAGPSTQTASRRPTPSGAQGHDGAAWRRQGHGARAHGRASGGRADRRDFAADASSFLDDKGGPPGTGQLIVALDPAAFGGADAVARFGALAVTIEAQAGARLPGRRRLALREKARREGLPIADALLLEIENL